MNHSSRMMALTISFLWMCMFSQLFAQTPAQRVMATARFISETSQEVIHGGCWDFPDAVFYRAGFPPAARRTLCMTKASGPYVDYRQVQPGDWLYIQQKGAIVDHSVIFISWKDLETKEANVYDYGGTGRKSKAYFNTADCSQIWGIIRATEENSWAALPMGSD